MTSELEQVIIDGIDVSECEHLIPNKNIKCCECSACCTPYPECVSYDSCEGTNCYFKKLQRLKKENEELQEELEFSRTHKSVIDAERMKLKQALEEVKVTINKMFHIPLSEKDCCECDENFSYLIGKIKEVLTDE